MKHLLSVLLFASTLVWGQPQFHHLNVSDGLSQNSILSMCQDSIGFLWFGTAESGLNKFDGKRFTYYNHVDGDNRTISSNSITQLTAGDKGDIWIGTNNGLTYYNALRDEFSPAYYHDKNNILYSFSRQDITCIKKSEQGRIWVIASRKVFYKEPGDSIFKICTQLNHSPVRDIEPVSDSGLLVAYGDNLYHYQLNSKSLKATDYIKTEFSPINCIYQDKKGNIYAGARKKGIAVYNASRDTTIYFSSKTHPKIKSNFIRTFCEDPNGDVYIGSFNGLYRIQPRSMKFEAYYAEDNHTNALSHNSIYDILKDNAGNLWFATYSGGVSIKYETLYDFVTYTRNVDKKGSLRSNVINTFYEDKFGTWIGTDGAGLSHLHNGIFKHHVSNKGNPASISGNHVKVIHKHSNNYIWVGGHQSGLDLFNQSKNIAEKNYFPQRGIYSIAQGKDSLLWLASPGNGVLFFDEQTKSPVIRDSIPLNKILYAKFLYYSPEKQIMWICTTTGVFFYDYSSNQLIEVKDFASQSYSIDNIHHLNEDSKGNTWIATANGLLMLSDLNTGNGDCNIQYFNSQNILPNNNIMSVLEDTDNNIWLSTINCIVKLNQSFTSAKIYNHDYNIQANDFSKAAGFKSNDGRLWFGGNGGLTVFDPLKIGSNTFIPDLAFTKLKINDYPVKPNDASKILSSNIASTDKISLQHWQNNISLSVTAFNYTMPDRNQFKWIFTNQKNITINGSSADIAINNLAPGNYQLKVWGSNNDNLWNSVPLEFQISIHPPWYKSNMAFLAYIIFTMLLIIIGRKVIFERTRVLNQLKIEKLQKIQKEKLHNQKVQFFTNISHEIRTPLSLIAGPLEHVYNTSESSDQKKHLQIVTRNVNHLKKLIDELIDFRKLDGSQDLVQVTKLNIKEFVKNITDLFEKSLAYQNIPIQFKASIDRVVFFDPVILEKIISNILFNAYKYNQNKQEIAILVNDKDEKEKKYPHAITIGKAISKKDKYAVITVIDQGIGISEDQLDKIFDNFYQASPATSEQKGYGLGLAFVKKLVELHKGELKVSSKPGAGSTFSLKIPVGANDYNETEFRRTPFKYEANAIVPDNPGITKAEISHKKEHTVLIVEDNNELRDWMNLFLSSQYHCIIASNGREGVEIALKRIPDIIISDVMMPQLNGHELCESLKSNVKTSHIPIILLTAKSSDLDRKEGIGSGADAYISKPFDTEILIYQINNFIQLKKKILENYYSNTEDSSSSFINSLSVIDKKLIKSVYSYINDNLSNPNLNVDDMAKGLFTSRSSLYRKIKSLTNTTPNEFIKDYRLKIAHGMIKEKKQSLFDISESVGFQDVYYFKKCFIKKYGIKPDEI